MKKVIVVTLIVANLLLTGCSHFVSRAANSFGNNLTGAILNQDDPELVRAGMPSYILLLDSFLQGKEDNPAILSSASTMYASYGSVFADDPVRAKRLTRRAREYADQAMCLTLASSCNWRSLPYDAFVANLQQVSSKQADLLYAYGFAFLAYIRAHSDDWNALAELPQAEAVMQHYLDISGVSAKASAHNYLGILMTIRPPALGGKQDVARGHFETAIAMSGGRDLSPKVEMLKGIARTLYDRELNDQLCADILGASPYAEGLTLTNVLARDEALALCSDSDNYF
ncbi:MAG: TRAP transporter TatT component family protein [Gammaproteobacteria bacterium]|nr:TRAP transporter TatT component family protein [Gammaproteobacteria bacterium]MDH5302932.1 TRAP transporter TatT component family protein [Gammaproteobacteria bacterium]MDH5321154.1 TRAP transporter TatT component family protein [Gammaproteobacteria bacterium]